MISRPSFSKLLCSKVYKDLIKVSSTYSNEVEHNKIYGDNITERGIPKTIKAFQLKRCLQIEQPQDSKVNKVSILGMPNSGKSTLTNQLVGLRVSSVSHKVHTTRKNIVGVFNVGSTQVEILDTPGISKIKSCFEYGLEHTFINHPILSSNVADIIAVIVDASDKKYQHFLNVDVFKILEKNKDKISILVLNKVDLIKGKRDILKIADNLTGCCLNGKSLEGSIKKQKKPKTMNSELELEKIFQNSELSDSNDNNVSEINNSIYSLSWPNFSRIFMISALNGDGVNDLRDYLIETAKPGLWRHHPSIVTSQNPKDIILSTIKGKLLDILNQEIPYSLKLLIECWEVDEIGTLNVAVNIFCPKSRYVPMVLGPKGSYIAKIAALAQDDLSNTFHCDVYLKLIVKYMNQDKK